jgi:hypothetical protein
MFLCPTRKYALAHATALRRTEKTVEVEVFIIACVEKIEG